VVTAGGPLSDLLPDAHATDGGEAQLFAVAPGDGNTYFVFILTGLDPASADTTYGAHVHVGPCVDGNGPLALGHYNTGTGGDPSPENEVWLDFTVRPDGVGVAYATAPFVAPSDSVNIRSSPPTKLNPPGGIPTGPLHATAAKRHDGGRVVLCTSKSASGRSVKFREVRGIRGGAVHCHPRRWGASPDHPAGDTYGCTRLVPT
jgi:hypothetical protein